MNWFLIGCALGCVAIAVFFAPFSEVRLALTGLGLVFLAGGFWLWP